MKITKNTTLAKVLDIKGAEEVLFKHNIPCMHCGIMHLEMEMLKIGDICKAYGLDADKLLKNLNKLSA